MFQSSPAARGGRNHTSACIASPASCFNPRPLHAAGATRPPQPHNTRTSCFNPRPLHAAGATTMPARSTSDDTCFNPRPLHAAGATPAVIHARPPRGCFNPRPLHAAGATRAGRALPRLARVSILARCTRRAQRSRSNFLIRLSESEIFREPPATAPERVDLTRRAVRNDQPAQCVRTRANPRANYLHCNSAHHTTSGPSKSTDRKFPNCLIWISAGSVRR